MVKYSVKRYRLWNTFQFETRTNKNSINFPKNVTMVKSSSFSVNNEPVNNKSEIYLMTTSRVEL